MLAFFDIVEYTALVNKTELMNLLEKINKKYLFEAIVDAYLNANWRVGVWPNGHVQSVHIREDAELIKQDGVRIVLEELTKDKHWHYDYQRYTFPKWIGDKYYYSVREIVEEDVSFAMYLYNSILPKLAKELS